jgi:hypothetical protein
MITAAQNLAVKYLSIAAGDLATLGFGYACD